MVLGFLLFFWFIFFSLGFQLALASSSACQDKLIKKQQFSVLGCHISCMLFMPQHMDAGLKLLEMFRWGLVLENAPATRLLLRSLNCYTGILIQRAGWTFYIFRMSSGFLCLNLRYFRSNILDKQLSHVQGWKDFPAAEAVTGTLGNVPKCLTDWFPYCSSKHWR